MTQPQDKMRAEFELWYAQRFPKPRHENSTWDHAEKMDALEVWQAACAQQSAQSQQDALDAARLDALEEIARKSSTGVSIDYVRFVEEGHVVENGYRVMRRGVLYERKKTIRSAIDEAIAAQGASNV